MQKIDDIQREEHLPSIEAQSIMPKGMAYSLIVITVAIVVGVILAKTLPYEKYAAMGVGLLAFVAILWFTEVVHISVTALSVPLIAIALGMPKAITDGKVVPLKMADALSGFSSPIIYLFLGGFALAAALQVQNLDRKIAAKIISVTGSNLLWATIALCGVTAFLSMWISNTATAAMILPLAVGMLSTIDKKDHGTRVFLLLAVAYSASIGGIGTLIGSPPNAIAAQQLKMGFDDWLPYGLPIMLILMPLMFVVLYIVCRPNLTQKIDKIEDDIPMTTPRILTLIVFVVAALAWIFGKKIAALGINSPDTFVALAAIMAVTVLRLARWKDIDTYTDWGVLLLFGGGIALSNILKSSGASLALGQTVANHFGHYSVFVVILVVAAFIIFLTEFTSNTASAALLVPVFATIASQMGIPDKVLVLIIGIGASCAFMLPVATPPNAIVFGTGEIRQKDMLRAGIWLNIVSILFISAYAYFFFM